MRVLDAATGVRMLCTLQAVEASRSCRLWQVHFVEVCQTGDYVDVHW